MTPNKQRILWSIVSLLFLINSIIYLIIENYIIFAIWFVASITSFIGVFLRISKK